MSTTPTQNPPPIPPDHPWAVPLSHLRHSLAAGRAGRQREAVAAALAAFKARVGAPELLMHLAGRLLELGEVRAMYACANDLSVVRGGHPQVSFGLANMLAAAGFPGDALQLIQKIRAAGVDGSRVQWLAGLCLEDLGRIEDAARELRAGFGTPESAPLLLALSQMPPTRTIDDAELQSQLETAAAACAEDDARLPMLLYALFAVLDRQGQHEAAWQALERGLPLRGNRIEYDPKPEQALSEYITTRRGAAAAGEAASGPRPVFIVGMPGAGIEGLARQLAVHPEVADAGPLNDLVMQLRWACDQVGGPVLDLKLAHGAASIDFAQLGRAYLAHTQWRAGDKPVFLDRNGDNYACIPWIMQALPGARVLHMVGGPMDTCFANLARWAGREHAWSRDQEETADHYRRYRALMAHMRGLYPDRVHDVRHDELAENPGAALREAIEFCGLQWDDRLTVEPPRDGAPAGQWRHYEDKLGPMRKRLGALAY